MSVNPRKAAHTHKTHTRCGSDLTPKHSHSAAAASNGYQRPASVWVSYRKEKNLFVLLSTPWSFTSSETSALVVKKNTHHAEFSWGLEGSWTPETALASGSVLMLILITLVVSKKKKITWAILCVCVKDWQWGTRSVRARCSLQRWTSAPLESQSSFIEPGPSSRKILFLFFFFTDHFSFCSGMPKLFTPARQSTAMSWVFHRGRCSQTVRTFLMSCHFLS